MDSYGQALMDSMPAHMRPKWCPSPSEVRQKARAYTDRLFQDRETLQQIVERQEPTIRKRWAKKTNSQKKKILLHAWPDMSTQHRPDVEAWRRNSKNREAYLWPYINLEDLLKTKALLLLLHSRGRTQPHVFVHSDLEQARLGEITKVTEPGFLNEYTMLFHGRTTPDTYGELVHWDDGELFFEYLQNGLGMHPGHGLLALEIQQRIWSFLVECCQLLLQDLSPLNESEVLPNPGPPANQREDVTSLEIMAAEAPYRVPASFDIKRLLAMTLAERDSREEHIWALREDPSYFADFMEDWAAHRPEVLPDAYDRKHPTQTEPGRPTFWNIVFSRVVVESYMGFATFDQLGKDVKSLESLLSRYMGKITQEDDLPEDLMEAFQNLRFTLEATKKGLIKLLEGVFSSPPMRPFCHRVQKDLSSSKMSLVYTPPPQDDGRKRVMPLFRTLFDEQQLFLFGLHPLTDEIGHLIENDPAVKEVISPWVASQLSSLSVVSECLHQLHLFQPWARKIEDGAELNEDKLVSTYGQTFGPWRPILGVNLEKSSLYRYADPTDGKFHYPIQRRRNRKTVEESRAAESRLDAMWKALDYHYRSTATSRKSPHDLVVEALDSKRTIQRTPPWGENEKKGTAPQGLYDSHAFSGVSHDPSKQITGSFGRISLNEKKDKPKTGGEPSGGREDETSLPSIPHETVEPKPAIPVDRRTYKVFRSLFYSADNDLPGEIPWLDFVHAMVTMGFSAEKLHGSAWNFAAKSSDIGMERGIQFHEPHPNSKIPFHVGRRYGRRLTRAYGWSGQTFRLE